MELCKALLLSIVAASPVRDPVSEKARSRFSNGLLLVSRRVLETLEFRAVWMEYGVRIPDKFSGSASERLMVELIQAVV